MNLLFINTKKNWGGIANLSAVLMRTLSQMGAGIWCISGRKYRTRFSFPKDVHLLHINFGYDYNPLTILKVAAEIKKNRIDHVVVNTAKEIIFGGIAARICGIKCFRLVGNELDFESHRQLNARLVDVNIFPSQYTLNQATASFAYVSKLKNRVLYCGIEQREISEHEMSAEYARIKASPANLIIGCTGRIVETKGVQTLIRAFAKIHNGLESAILVINGSGEYLPEIVKLAENLGVGEKVRILGFTPDCLVSASVYDIAVMPSHFEGFPNTLIEYVSLGKAIITTNVGGIAEAITDRGNGLFFEVDNVDELATQIMLLANDRELALKLGSHAYASYQESYTSQKMANAFTTIMEELK